MRPASLWPTSDGQFAGAPSSGHIYGAAPANGYAGNGFAPGGHAPASHAANGAAPGGYGYPPEQQPYGRAQNGHSPHDHVPYGHMPHDNRAPFAPQPVARPQAAAPLPPQAAPARPVPPQQRKPVAAEVGCFFRDLRLNFKLSQAEAARRLATRVDIIAALEAGDVGSLPPWPETCRIVRMYTSLVGLDPRPILRLIELLQTSAGRTPLPAQNYDDDEERSALGGMKDAVMASFARAWHGRAGRAGRVLVAAAVPVALVVLLTQTTVLEAAVAQLPPPVKRIVRGAQNYVIVQLAPVRDGLRWIDVPDPRTRRGDKLQVRPNSD